MRIPTQTLPTVEPRALPKPDITDGVRGIGQASANALSTLSKGVGQLGEGVGDFVDAKMKADAKKEAEVKRVSDEARKRAEDTEALEAETALAHRLGVSKYGDAGTDPKVVDITTAASGEPLAASSHIESSGFLTKKGKAASEAYADTMKDIGKSQAEIETGLHSDGAKQRFRRRSEVMIESTRQDFQQHINTENQAAAVDALKGRQQQLIDDAYRDPYHARMGVLDGPIRSIARTPEGAEAAIAAHDALVAEAQVKSLIAKKDWKTAEAVLKTGLLGDKAKGYEQQVETVKTDAKAGQVAAKAVTAATGPDGTVDEAEVVRQITAEQADATSDIADGQLAKRLLSEGLRRARAINSAEKAKTKQISDKSSAAFAGRERFEDIPPDLREQLKKRNWPLYDRLLHHEENLMLRRQAARRAGIGSEDRLQEIINRDALRAYYNHSPEERAQMNITTEYAGTGVNRSGMDLIGGHQKKDIERWKTHGEKENAFVSSVLNDAKARRQVSGKQSDVATAALRSEASAAFNDWVDTHEGKVPEQKDADLIQARLLQKQLVPGKFFGTNEKPQWKLDQEARAKKTPTPAQKPSKVERAKALKAEGKSLKAIADTLNAEGY